MTEDEGRNGLDACLARAVTGDPDALERLLLASQKRLTAYVRGMIGPALRPAFDESDLIQEACKQAFRRIGTLQADTFEGFIHWLLTIARHQLIDWLRKSGRGPTVHGQNNEESVIELLKQAAASHRTPSQSAARREAIVIVIEALGELPESYRVALRLRYFEGLAVKDIAARMDKTDRAVHNYCTKGLARLRDILGSRSNYLSSTA